MGRSGWRQTVGFQGTPTIDGYRADAMCTTDVILKVPNNALRGHPLRGALAAAESIVKSVQLPRHIGPRLSLTGPPYFTFTAAAEPFGLRHIALHQSLPS